jgi:predicted nucleic acid-binding protein
MCCCAHGRLEVWTAVKRNVREGLITSAEASSTFQRFQEDEAAGVWHWLPVEMRWVHLACDQVAAAPETVFLRAADALHLVCAVGEGFREIFTHDRHMLAAATVFGIHARDVIAEN